MADWKPPRVPGEHPWKRDNKVAVRVDVVGWEADPDSVVMRDRIVPSVVHAGYDASYVEYADWTGPGLITVPQLFYYDETDTIVIITVGIKTKREVIRYLIDPV